MLLILLCFFIVLGSRKRFFVLIGKCETGGTAGKMNTGRPRGVSPYFKSGKAGLDSANCDLPVFATTAALPQMGFNLV